jgi:DNA polymerase-4
MSVDTAKRKCPDLKVVDPVPAEYLRAQKYLLEHAARLSPQAEIAGPGHLFVDLTGTQRLLGSSIDIAETVRKELKADCRLECAAGLATNRLVSKIATRVIKPNGLCTVKPGCEEDFMAPLPVSFLPGLEPRLLEQLVQFNLRLIKDLNRIPPSTLATALGTSAYEISRQSHGIDDTPVREFVKPALTVCESITLGEQTNDESEIAGALFHLVSRAGAKIRKAGLAAGKIKLSLVYADGGQVTRSISLQIPVRGDLSLFEQCALLLQKIFTRRVRISELTAEFNELTFPYGQADLFIDNQREESLMTAIDSIRGSFGEKAIKFWGRQRIA